MHDDALKVGITSEDTNRLRYFDAYGWRLYRSWTFERRIDAARFEQRAISHWRRNGWPPAVGYLPGGGATETVARAAVTPGAAAQYIDDEVAIADACGAFAAQTPDDYPF